MQRYFFGIVLAFALFALVYAETTCETHRRNSRPSGHGVSWNIQCDSEGNYLPMQCMNGEEKDKWCSCYNETDQITSPSKKTRHCNCPLAQNKALNKSPPERCVPECSTVRTYHFIEKQCCDNVCKCVDPITGEQKQDQSCLNSA